MRTRDNSWIDAEILSEDAGGTEKPTDRNLTLCPDWVLCVGEWNEMLESVEHNAEDLKSTTLGEEAPLGFSRSAGPQWAGSMKPI